MTMMLGIRMFTVVSLVALAACGTGEVRQKDPSTYVVYSQYGSLNGSWDRAQKEATAKGTKFCSEKGQQFVLIDEKREGVVGFSPQSSTITFSCAPDTSAAIQAASGQCKDDLQTPELHAIRHKVKLFRESP